MRLKKDCLKTLSWFLAFLTFFTCSVPGAGAITISEEDKLATEFMGYMKKTNRVISDPDIDEYINRIGKKIAKEFPNPPFQCSFYVFMENSYNAFAGPGGHVFVNSGLIEAMDSEDELAGIIGHEISHVYLRHISNRIDYSQKVSVGALAGIVAGILLGVGGAGAAASAITAGSMAAGQSLTLAYTRENEVQADQIGLERINSSGYSATGLLDSMTKIRAKQWFGSDQIPTYLLTHPANEERMSYIKSWVEEHEKGKTFSGSSDPAAFKRIKARIMGLYGDSKIILKQFDSLLAKNPGDENQIYGQALAYWRMGEYDKAMGNMRKLLKKNAFDSDYMRDTGIIQFSKGDTEAAFAALSVPGKRTDALRSLYLARAYMAKEKYPEAERILSMLIKDKDNFEDGFYYMAEVSEKMGKNGFSHYYLGVYESMIGRPRQTVYHLDRAMPSLASYPDMKKKAEELLKEALKEMKKEREEKEIQDREKKDDDWGVKKKTTDTKTDSEEK
ncbi:M48 family metallopeptidase [Desulforegula conservatrix]|uniref:M48 family metallopeptidase n=1 Tax=Desulforegula conservatrix TaxID=153026 RepID=UPI000401EF3F|nr:M48 family metallopeptidase [Desulforegula conservatrix]